LVEVNINQSMFRLGYGDQGSIDNASTAAKRFLA